MGVSSCLPLQDVVASEAPGASADPPKDDIAVCHLGVPRVVKGNKSCLP